MDIFTQLTTLEEGNGGGNGVSGSTSTSTSTSTPLLPFDISQSGTGAHVDLVPSNNSLHSTVWSFHFHIMDIY